MQYQLYISSYGTRACVTMKYANNQNYTSEDKRYLSTFRKK